MVSGVFDDTDSIGDTLKYTGSEYYWLPVTVKVCGTCWVADKPGTPFGLSIYQYPLIINRIWLFIKVSGVFDDADSIGDTLIKDTGSEYYWLPV